MCWCRLDTRLYKLCHRDATRYCHAPQHWSSHGQPDEEAKPLMGHLVLACLYRSITRVMMDEEGDKEQQEMQQVGPLPHVLTVQWCWTVFFGCPLLRFGLLAVCLHMLLLLLINVQIWACMYSAPVVGWTLDKHWCIWLPTSSLLPTLSTLGSGPRLRGSASFHTCYSFGDNVSLLPVVVSNTLPLYLWYDMNYRHLENHWKDVCLRCSQLFYNCFHAP